MTTPEADTHVLFCNLRKEKSTEALPLKAGQSNVYQLDKVLEALSVKQGMFNVVVVNTTAQVKESIELFRQLREQYPGIARILISEPMQPIEVAQAAEVAHRCLPIDYSEAAIQEAVDRAIKAEQLLTQDTIRNHISSLGHLPSFPAILQELDEALRSEKANIKDVSAIVEKDPGVITKILQLVNSSYFGLSSQNCYNVKDAVKLLGLRTVRDLVLTSQMFEAMPQTPQWRGFSFEQLQERSVIVSQLAADICKEAGGSRLMQSQARLAGLLLDVGMIVLAMGNSEEYHQVMIRAQELGQPLYVVEKLKLGATHAQAGAFLLDRWNLSPEIVHAVLFHHIPGASGDVSFSALTAVHVADCLLPPLFNAMGCNLGGRLSRDYLKKIGAMSDLPKWEMRAHDVSRALRN